MLYNFWYIACAASRLGSKPRATRVLDQELVLFRDDAGKPHALLNRCCHRGVQLSLGKVVDGAIACRYHGWRYDGSGRCIHIPSLTADGRIPKGAEVPSYPCVEQDGYVWVWMSKPVSDLALPPPIPDFALYRWRQGSIPMQCDAMKGIENNVDWCHPYFTHPWTHGQFFVTRFRGFQEQSYEMRLTDHGLVVFAPVTASEEEPIPERPIVQLSFELPDRIRVEFWKPFHLITLIHLVPNGPNMCRLEWLVTRLLPIGPHVRWSNKEPRIFAQDRRILESAQRWYAQEGSDFERSVEADASTLLARRIVELAAEGLWEEKRFSLPRRRVVTVWV
jgi:phenylpropionate dioxygenase-like ring-hydroxylating dioxygenase large terminal subunit